MNVLVDLFRKNNVRSVLDATCGTGSQAIPLAKRGFAVTGSDIGPDMLRVARRKAEGVPCLEFIQGDVRSSRFGIFDAAIAMLNSLGYLNRSDFRRALSNINSNLRNGGLLVFDNTNRGWLDAGNYTTDRVIDTAGQVGTTKFVRFCKSEYNVDTGIMTDHWRTIVQDGYSRAMERKGYWKRQTYTIAELQNLLAQAGFILIDVLDRTGSIFDEARSISYLAAARKM